MNTRRIEALLLAVGMVVAAWVLGQALWQFKRADRSVEVKGRRRAKICPRFRQPLSKIKRANQGQFVIEDRDASTPYVKKVRIVSSVEYSLAD